jgi:endo-1,4-beta-xylanase
MFSSAIRYAIRDTDAGSSPSNINFNAQYYPGNQGGGGSLAVYGWTTNPLVEYYIMENYPSPPTSGLTFVGTVTSDGSNYNIYKHQQVNQPSISGTQTFMQYISIRQSPRSSGTITTGTHFNAWKSHGMNLGQFNYQIVSTEAYGGGQGASTVTVS